MSTSRVLATPTVTLIIGCTIVVAIAAISIVAICKNKRVKIKVNPKTGKIEMETY